jgi:hypothetical protein
MVCLPRSYPAGTAHRFFTSLRNNPHHHRWSTRKVRRFVIYFARSLRLTNPYRGYRGSRAVIHSGRLGSAGRELEFLHPGQTVPLDRPSGNCICFHDISHCARQSARTYVVGPFIILFLDFTKLFDQVCVLLIGNFDDLQWGKIRIVA